MLILVLIPVASAMDSNDTFYVEYDDSDYEEVVDEYVEYEVEETQNLEHSHEENVKSSDTINENIGEDSQYQDDIDKYYYNEEEAAVEPVVCIELNEDDVSVTHDQDVKSFEFVNSDVIYLDNLTDAINEETSEDDSTFDKNSVNQDLLINKLEIKNNFPLFDHTYNEINFYETSFDNSNRFLTKILELKDNLLLKQDMHVIFNNYVIDDLEEIISINKITSDYAYNIDNSIVGAESIVTCFLNFKSFFDTVFSYTFVVIFFYDADFINY